jgi:hypothetical protein
MLERIIWSATSVPALFEGRRMKGEGRRAFFRSPLAVPRSPAIERRSRRAPDYASRIGITT